MNNILVLILSFFFLFSCDKKRNKTLNLSYKYIKDNKYIILNFKNNTDADVVFLAPNVIEFESVKNKNY